MSPDRDRSAAGYAPRLLSAAAFLTNRATEESLTELRLTHERSVILRLLSGSPADEEMLSGASGLAPGCVRDCVLALQSCGYITASGPRAAWTITSAGVRICTQADDAETRLMALGDNDVEGLRRELQDLIRALTPPR